MGRFVLNLNDGRVFLVEGTLSNAKSEALTYMGANKRNIQIEAVDGEVLSVAKWRSGWPSSDDCAMYRRWFGYYELWSDELHM